MMSRPVTRLEKAEFALKQLIDYAMAMNKIAIEKGLWTLEEFNRAAANMDRERRILGGLGHNTGLYIMTIAKKLSEFKPKMEEK